jgi:hypothetical protein
MRSGRSSDLTESCLNVDSKTALNDNQDRPDGMGTSHPFHSMSRGETSARSCALLSLLEFFEATLIQAFKMHIRDFDETVIAGKSIKRVD